MSRRNRSLLSLSLTSLALTLSVCAFCTSYWCEGTHKVVKPLCLSPVKMKNCGQNNSQPYTTGEDTGDVIFSFFYGHCNNFWKETISFLGTNRRGLQSWVCSISLPTCFSFKFKSPKEKKSKSYTCSAQCNTNIHHGCCSATQSGHKKASNQRGKNSQILPRRRV